MTERNYLFDYKKVDRVGAVFGILAGICGLLCVLFLIAAVGAFFDEIFGGGNNELVEAGFVFSLPLGLACLLFWGIRALADCLKDLGSDTNALRKKLDHE